MCYVYCIQIHIHSPLSQYKYTNKRLDKAKYPTICSLNANKRDRMSVIKFIYSKVFICIFSQIYKCELFRLILNSSNCRLLCTRTNSIHFIVVAVVCLLFCSVVLLVFFFFWKRAAHQECQKNFLSFLLLFFCIFFLLDVFVCDY